MQMDRQWMYNADRRSKEFIDGLHYFLSVAEVNKQNGFMCCPALIATIIRITPLQESYTATFSQMVSWRSIFVGRSTRTGGYHGRQWRIRFWRPLSRECWNWSIQWRYSRGRARSRCNRKWSQRRSGAGIAQCAGRLWEWNGEVEVLEVVRGPP